jgi:hypothetical protein
MSRQNFRLCAFVAAQMARRIGIGRRLRWRGAEGLTLPLGGGVRNMRPWPVVGRAARQRSTRLSSASLCAWKPA